MALPNEGTNALTRIKRQYFLDTNGKMLKSGNELRDYVNSRIIAPTKSGVGYDKYTDSEVQRAFRYFDYATRGLNSKQKKEFWDGFGKWIDDNNVLNQLVQSKQQKTNVV